MRSRIIIFCLFLLFPSVFAQELREYYKIVNDFLRTKSDAGVKTYLYFKAGDFRIYDKNDSLVLKKDELKSKFKLLSNAKIRKALVDSLFAQFDFKYMKTQSKTNADQPWEKSLLSADVVLFKKANEVKAGFSRLDISLPIFIDQKHNWAFLQDDMEVRRKIILLKKENQKWEIVEEYIFGDQEE